MLEHTNSTHKPKQTPFFVHFMSLNRQIRTHEKDLARKDQQLQQMWKHTRRTFKERSLHSTVIPCMFWKLLCKFINTEAGSFALPKAHGLRQSVSPLKLRSRGIAVLIVQQQLDVAKNNITVTTPCAISV